MRVKDKGKMAKASVKDLRDRAIGDVKRLRNATDFEMLIGITNYMIASRAANVANDDEAPARSRKAAKDDADDADDADDGGGDDADAGDDLPDYSTYSHAKLKKELEAYGLDFKGVIGKETDKEKQATRMERALNRYFDLFAEWAPKKNAIKQLESLAGKHDIVIKYGRGKHSDDHKVEVLLSSLLSAGVVPGGGAAKPAARR